MNNSDVICFVRVSSVLTGFSEFELNGTGQSQAYYEWVMKEVPDELVQILNALDNLPSNPELAEEQVRSRVMSQVGLGSVARSIIKLWYLGQWDYPYSGNTTILSASSYREGLVWNAISAHPQGAKQQGFGAWALRPDELCGEGQNQ